MIVTLGLFASVVIASSRGAGAVLETPNAVPDGSVWMRLVSLDAGPMAIVPQSNFVEIGFVWPVKRSALVIAIALRTRLVSTASASDR